MIRHSLGKKNNQFYFHLYSWLILTFFIIWNNCFWFNYFFLGWWKKFSNIAFDIIKLHLPSFVIIRINFLWVYVIRSKTLNWFLCVFFFMMRFSNQSRRWRFRKYFLRTSQSISDALFKICRFISSQNVYPINKMCYCNEY